PNAAELGLGGGGRARQVQCRAFEVAEAGVGVANQLPEGCEPGRLRDRAGNDAVADRGKGEAVRDARSELAQGIAWRGLCGCLLRADGEHTREQEAAGDAGRGWSIVRPSEHPICEERSVNGGTRGRAPSRATSGSSYAKVGRGEFSRGDVLDGRTGRADRDQKSGAPVLAEAPGRERRITSQRG